MPEQEMDWKQLIERVKQRLAKEQHMIYEIVLGCGI